ncbi:MAG: hypothetical protein AB7G06_07740 [Bdellovibrionales bacterium]
MEKLLELDRQLHGDVPNPNELDMKFRLLYNEEDLDGQYLFLTRAYSDTLSTGSHPEPAHKQWAYDTYRNNVIAAIKEAPTPEFANRVCYDDLNGHIAWLLQSTLMIPGDDNYTTCIQYLAARGGLVIGDNRKFHLIAESPMNKLVFQAFENGEAGNRNVKDAPYIELQLEQRLLGGSGRNLDDLKLDMFQYFGLPLVPVYLNGNHASASGKPLTTIGFEVSTNDVTRYADEAMAVFNGLQEKAWLVNKHCIRRADFSKALTGVADAILDFE